MRNFSILPYRKLRGKLRVITVTLPALRTLLMAPMNRYPEERYIMFKYMTLHYITLIMSSLKLRVNGFLL